MIRAFSVFSLLVITKLKNTVVGNETVVRSETGMLLVGLAGGAGAMLGLGLLYKVLSL